MYSHKSTTRLEALRRSLTRPGESARELSTRSQWQCSAASESQPEAGGPVPVAVTLREQPLTLRCPLTPSRRPALSLPVTRRLVVLVLAYCHLAATSAENLPYPRSPVGLAMEGAPRPLAPVLQLGALTGRSRQLALPGCRAGQAWPQRLVAPCQ